jgi:hypothetical protein
LLGNGASSAGDNPWRVILAGFILKRDGNRAFSRCRFIHFAVSHRVIARGQTGLFCVIFMF